MAAPSSTTWGSEVNGKGKIGINVTLTNSSSGTTTSVTIDVYFWSKYSAVDSSNTFYFNNKAASATTSRGSVSINHTVSSGGGWSTSNQTKLGTYTYNYSRGTSAQTFNCAAKLTGIDYVGGTMTVSKSYTIPELASYTVKYNANGGSGAPPSQTKYHGKNLTLQSKKPTRDGYTFKNWLSLAQSKNYDPGDLYGYNAATTMKAQWTAITYTVKYNANGGSGAPSNQTKTYGKTLTLSSVKPTRESYSFLGWATSANATEAAYTSGASYEDNNNLTLYAVWELDYKEPRVIIGFAKRLNDEGTSAIFSISWECDPSTTVKSIKYRYKKATDAESAYTAYNTINLGSGPSAIPVLGGGSLSPSYAYNFNFSIEDNNGHTNSSLVVTIPSSAFVIDFLSGGNGVAMGKAATQEGIFECGFTQIDKFGTLCGNGLAFYGSGTEDANTTIEPLILTSTNVPSGTMFVLTLFYADKTSTANRAQIAVPYNGLGSMYHRYYNGSWSDWRRHRNATNDGLTSLWSGSWSSGTIIVPDTALYKMFVIKNSAQALYIPCFKYNNNVRGGTFFTNDAGSTQYMSDFSATISGNNWTYGQATARQNTKTWASTNIKGRTITDIYGVM